MWSLSEPCISLLEQAAESLQIPFSDTASFALWRKTRIAGRSSFAGKRKATWNPFPCGTTAEHSTVEHGVAQWISSLRDSPASRSASPETSKARTTTETDGPTPSESYARWDRGSLSWKTYQDCLLTRTSEPYSGSYPRQGLMQGGRLYPLRSLEHPIGEKGSGYLPTPSRVPYGSSQNGINGIGGQFERPSAGTPSLETMARRNQWPTPTKGDAKSSGSRNLPGSKAHAGMSLTDAVVHGSSKKPRRYPTPKSTPSGPDYARVNRPDSGGDDLATNVARSAPGQLNPDWVEWLMSWPIGWTSLEPLESIDGWQSGQDEWFVQDPADAGQTNRTATNIKHRTHRLAALGDGQVPIVAATALEMLKGVA